MFINLSEVPISRWTDGRVQEAKRLGGFAINLNRQVKPRQLVQIIEATLDDRESWIKHEEANSKETHYLFLTDTSLLDEINNKSIVLASADENGYIYKVLKLNLLKEEVK